MHQMSRTTLAIAAAGLASTVFSKLSAQASDRPGTAAPTPACALLSSEEINKATGRNDYPAGDNGDADGEGAGGGSSCQYGGETLMPGDHPPMLSFVFIQGKGYTERRRTGKLPPGCKIESVKGVGDDAFFESCPSSRSTRSAPLFVKAGANDLIVQLDVEPPATEASVRPTVIAVAKAAVAKLPR
jgi:hypothetical protein